MKLTKKTLLVLTALGVFASCGPVYADQSMAQYSVTAWGHKDGLPSTVLYAIAQTTDGFLWLGTADGLMRFDGVQFTPWRPATPNRPSLGQVRSLCAPRHGGLLLGTGTGLVARVRNGDLQFTQLHSAVESIQESRDGSLWVATRAALWHLDEASLQPLQSFISMPKGWLSGPLQDSDGKEWITTQQGAFHVEAGSLVQSGDRPSWLFRRQDGHLALLDQSGQVRLLQNRETGGQGNAPLPYFSTLAGVTADSSGNLWLASRGDGVIRLAMDGNRTSAERFTREDGLSCNFVSFVFEDREHNLWAATENGLDRLRRNSVLSLTSRNGLLSDTVTSVVAAKDGSIWLATPEGLERVRHGEHTVYLKGISVLSLLMGRNQRLWVGSARGLRQWREGRIVPVEGDAGFSSIAVLAEDATGTLWFYDGGRGLFRQQPDQSPAAVTDAPLLHQLVTAMIVGPHDEMWFGLADGDIVVDRAGDLHTYSKQDGLPGAPIHGLSLDPTGKLWVATENGLCFFSDTLFACKNTQNGLPGDRALWALPDVDGNIWIGYNMGVARVDAQQLSKVGNAGSAELHAKLFDDGDGIQSSPDLTGNAPAVLAPDGRLWLTTSEGVAVLDPKHLRTNLLPPPVHILGLEADGKEIGLSGPIRLPPLTRSIQFSFTALSLSDPRKVRFRYRLDGFDREWHDGGARRDAFYTNLPPRRYAFRVRAANNDGIWNDTGAAIDFLLKPAYFQTVWFLLLCIGAALLGVALVFRARLQAARRNIRMRYEERVEERTRIAQELHDHLIQEMVGIGMQLEVIDELTPEDTGAKRPVERALTLSRSAIASGRLTLQALRARPVSGLAFIETLRRTAEAYAEKERVQYVVEGEERMLRPEIAEDLSEVGQEALRNALKHAGVGSIIVRLYYGSTSLELQVRDHGPGVTDDVLRTGVPGHYGLAGMRERAARMSAEFAIHRAPGQGTTVHLSVPGARVYQDDPDSTTNRLGSIFPWSRAASRQEKEK